MIKISSFRLPVSRICAKTKKLFLEVMHLDQVNAWFCQIIFSYIYYISILLVAVLALCRVLLTLSSLLELHVK